MRSKQMIGRRGHFDQPHPPLGGMDAEGAGT